MSISNFLILPGWIERYKTALSKSASSWYNLYCVRLIIVLLDVNVGRLQFLVSDDDFFWCVFINFGSDFSLWDVMDHLLISKSIVDSCLDKKVSDWLSYFESLWSSLLNLLMGLRRSLLRINKHLYLRLYITYKYLIPYTVLRNILYRNT